MAQLGNVNANVKPSQAQALQMYCRACARGEYWSGPSQRYCSAQCSSILGRTICRYHSWGKPLGPTTTTSKMDASIGCQQVRPWLYPEYSWQPVPSERIWGLSQPQRVRPTWSAKFGRISTETHSIQMYMQMDNWMASIGGNLVYLLNHSYLPPVWMVTYQKEITPSRTEATSNINKIRQLHRLGKRPLELSWHKDDILSTENS